MRLLRTKKSGKFDLEVKKSELMELFMILHELTFDLKKEKCKRDSKKYAKKLAKILGLKFR